MSFWVEHGLHLALVAVPSSAMGVGLVIERRKGQQHRSAAPSGAAPAPMPTGFLRVGSQETLPWWHEASQPSSSHPATARPATAGHPLALPAVAVASAGAALTHLVVMPEHFSESFLYGMFFLCAAVLQLVWAGIVAYRPTRSVLIAGALGCAATIALWSLSRTVGIPAALGGVDGGAPEAVGALDVLATAFELVAVVGVVALRGRSLSGGSPARWPFTAKMIGVTALCFTAAVAFWAPVN